MPRLGESLYLVEPLGTRTDGIISLNAQQGASRLLSVTTTSFPNVPDAVSEMKRWAATIQTCPRFSVSYGSTRPVVMTIHSWTPQLVKITLEEQPSNGRIIKTYVLRRVGSAVTIASGSWIRRLSGQDISLAVELPELVSLVERVSRSIVKLP